MDSLGLVEKAAVILIVVFLFYLCYMQYDAMTRRRGHKRAKARKKPGSNQTNPPDAGG